MVKLRVSCLTVDLLFLSMHAGTVVLSSIAVAMQLAQNLVLFRVLLNGSLISRLGKIVLVVAVQMHHQAETSVTYSIIFRCLSPKLGKVIKYCITCPTGGQINI